MSRDRPSFRRRVAPPEIRSRVVAMAVLLVIGVLLLGLRTWWNVRQPDQVPQVVVEVQGDVPVPGFHALPGPASVHAALIAAGLDPTGMPDRGLAPGTRLVVDGRDVKVERMDKLLVVGLPIDINTAGEDALVAVPGIGPGRAAAIVAERKSGGPYGSVDDLVRVRGIGPPTVETLRPFLTAGQ